MLTSLPTNFWFGIFGNLSIELASALRECTDLGGALPPRFKRLPFLIFPLMFAVVAGSKPVMMNAASELSACYPGASAPLFLDKLQRGVDPSHASADA